MSDVLTSVGLDVGTTSTQMIVSRLRVENRASVFVVPELEITEREVLYRSPVHFTPLLSPYRMDAQGLKMLIAEEYRQAGIIPADVDTGAVIITGETSRKENAAAVMQALADMAGDFVVATAGPDLESVLAAKGSGAVEYSRKTGKLVLHMDIGGGTSNLCLIRAGEILATGCFNVGGRLVRFDESGRLTYVSQVLRGISNLEAGQHFSQEQAEQLARQLTYVLEMAAGLRPWEQEAAALETREAGKWTPWVKERPVLSFSGGVADCIDTAVPWTSYGDIGPLLGTAIRKSSLCSGPYLLGKETIRATVIGAGCYAAQLSGSTVFHRNIAFPLKNLPVLRISETEDLEKKQEDLDGPAVLALKIPQGLSYRQIQKLAEDMVPRLKSPVLVCMERDMAKALGQALAVRLPEQTPLLCIDRVQVGEGSYLDIGAPVGDAMPVVVKTLVLEKEGGNEYE